VLFVEDLILKSLLESLELALELFAGEGSVIGTSICPVLVGIPATDPGI